MIVNARFLRYFGCILVVFWAVNWGWVVKTRCRGVIIQGYAGFTIITWLPLIILIISKNQNKKIITPEKIVLPIGCGLLQSVRYIKLPWLRSRRKCKWKMAARKNWIFIRFFLVIITIYSASKINKDKLFAISIDKKLFAKLETFSLISIK